MMNQGYDCSMTMEHRRTEMLWPFDCRTCHAKELMLIPDIANPEAFHIVRRCRHCGYLNVLERSVIKLPVTQAISGLPSDIQAQLLGGFEATAPEVILRQVSEAFVTHLDHMVALKTTAAAAGLTLLLMERERALGAVIEGQVGVANSSADLHAKVVSRVTDLLYALLHRNGCARVISDPKVVNEIGGPFVREFSEIASDAAAVALQAAGVEEGLWSVAGFVEGHLLIEKTEIHSRMAEWDLNRHEFENMTSNRRVTSIVDDIFTEETLSAQRLTLGFDSTDLITLGQEGFESLTSGLYHHGFDALWAARVDRLDHSRRRMVDRLTLGLSTIKGFIAPFYFDLGVPRRQPADEIRAVASVLLANWTNYYPVYELTDDSGDPWRVTSKAPFVICLANLATFRNSLFRRLVDAVAGQETPSPDTMRELRQVERRVGRRLEQAVATILRDDDWTCRLRLQKWKGSRLAFGDIDLIAAKKLDEQNTLVLLIEVKDYDMPVMLKKDALKRLQTQLQGAFEQLEVRSRWVAEKWHEGLSELLLPGVKTCSSQLLPVVVTARYMPPFLFDRFLGMPVDGLPMFLQQLSAEGLAVYGAVAGETLVKLDSSGQGH
jgi:Holliday junction resolvase-like predicted endonuclease